MITRIVLGQEGDSLQMERVGLQVLALLIRDLVADSLVAELVLADLVTRALLQELLSGKRI